MILAQKPARLDYRAGSARNSIYYDRAGFEGNDSEVAEKLRAVFESDAVDVESGTGIKLLSSQRVSAPQALSLALNDYMIDAGLRAKLKSFAKTMPPLHVHTFPLHRYGFHENARYLKIRMQYQQYGSFSMQDYLLLADDTKDEIVRLRVLMALYTLGLITPLESGVSGVKNGHKSIFSAIADKLKIHHL